MVTRHSTPTVTRQQESIESKSVSFPALFLSKSDCKTTCLKSLRTSPQDKKTIQ